MFGRGIRHLTTTARRAAESLAQMEGANQYGIGVSKAQGVVNGFVGGEGPANCLYSGQMG